MRNRPTPRRPDRSRVALAVAALALGAGLATPAPTRADGPPSPFELHDAIHDGVRHLLRDLVRVPLTIHRAHERHLRAFFGGTVFEPRHRHAHVVYRFPVWIDGVVVYRPYTYCGDRLYGAVPQRPLLWRDWGRGPEGDWCGHCNHYFPRGHAHFRTFRPDLRPRFDDRRHHDSRRWDDRGRHDDRRRRDDRGRGGDDDRHWDDDHHRGDHDRCDHDRGRRRR